MIAYCFAVFLPLLRHFVPIFALIKKARAAFSRARILPVAVHSTDPAVTRLPEVCSSSAAYFCKIFKRYKGMTPREYRAVIVAHAKGG